jgi:nucleoside-diphosphate-sugar epimerase
LGEVPWQEIDGFRADVCVHTAWITTPGVYLESPENERFRDLSLEFLRKLSGLGVRHIVGLGTCVEYQITDQPLSEDSTPVIPTTTYARCKNELRIALEADAQAKGLCFCWGRVFYPYGPGEHPSRLCSSIIQKLGRGEKITLKTPASTKDYIYINDLAAALLAVVEAKSRGAVNLGTGEGTSVRVLARGLAGLVGKRESIAEADPPDPDPFPYVVADATKLKGIGWRPAVTVEEGLRRLVDFWRELPRIGAN